MKSLKVPLVVIAVLHLLLISGLDARNAYTDLFNSRVVRAEKWERPLHGSEWSTWMGEVTHCGVVVTLQSGAQHLVHKGDSPGSQTVVTSKRNMGSNWRHIFGKSIFSSTVSHYVTAGDAVYFGNSHRACDRMMALG